MHLVCPAGSLPALKAALQQGADAIYVGFRDDTNARHFAGLNLDERQLETGLHLIRKRGRQLYVAVNTYAQPQGWARWQRAVDQAAALGVCRTFQVFRALGVSATIGALLPRARPYEPFCPS